MSTEMKNIKIQSYEHLKDELKNLIIPMIENISLDHYNHRALKSIIKNIQRYSDTIKCIKCDLDKPRKKFNDGHLTCSSCLKISNYHKTYYENNKDKIKNRKLMKQNDND